MKQLTLAILALLAVACHSELARDHPLAEIAARAAKEIPVKKDHISLADYSYLRIDMLRNEAEELLMTPGVERSSSQLDTSKMALYEWDLGANGAVTLRFQEGNLVGKSPYGLR
jgi:hypothetical protein